MEGENLVGSVIADPFERLTVRVACCMLAEPNYYKSAEEKVADIVKDLGEVLKIDPIFIVKLAYYARNELNLRSTPNFITAWAATHEECRAALRVFFPFLINLPSDLLDFAEKYQEITGNTEKPKFPTFIQTLIKKKFCEFSVYQLGKYCSEGKRKRKLYKVQKGPKKINLKELVRACHIKSPSFIVASVLGKKYPSTIEEFSDSKFASEGEFQPELAGKRLKIPTPATWETTLSEQGNKAECWESLINSNKLPFMAMLRNIRNLLITGVDPLVHQKVFEKLRNPNTIQNSRLFPFRFLSAYESIKINLEEMNKIKEDPNYVAPLPEGKKALKFNPKVKIPKIVPTQETIDGYNAALEEAIKLATALNVTPLRGNTAIFCDASGSMSCGISSGPFGSVRTCKDLGFLFGMMMRHVCETAEVYVFSSSPSGGEKCWKKAELQGENIFELVKQMNDIGATMGGGTQYPYDWFEKIIEEKHWIDNFIIFSDMIISTTENRMFGQNEQSQNCYEVLQRYRDAVNPELRYITVDLACHGKNLTGALLEDHGKNIVIGGYSDSILKLVNSLQTTQAGAVDACKPVKRGAEVIN